ncbi:MAG TPA: HAMP domain-containing sensor histidine kinase [Polyangiaceae bacterium]|nr:HAMP domain-containing sensor histidine kinase [Polyangiaceae bacterium]
MQATTDASGFEQIRREELARVFERLFATRRVLQPLMLMLMLCVVFSEGKAWRALVLLSAPLLALSFTLLEGRRLRREGVDRYHPARDFLVLSLVVPVAAVCTGGIESPVLVVITPMLLFLPTFCGARVARIASGAAVLLAVVLAFAHQHAPWMMPAPFVDAAGHTNGWFDAFFAAVFSLFALAASAYGVALRDMNDTMLQRSLAARAEALELYQERLRELTVLTGEIAHELKNPLASIKGLAQLMRVESAKNPRRLEVLESEVERMQGILEEFLNFSRPLLPLAQTEVDVSELCRDVVGLHEGLAAARRLTLTAPNERVDLVCDPRKLKQIVVNLVQNALDASLAGGEVRVSVARRDDHAAIQVLDRGHGLNTEQQARAFDLGFTSKARGSGLGLTIVRMLAEQHRGSARLYNRDGGGCVAEVLLPLDPPRIAASLDPGSL